MFLRRPGIVGIRWKSVFSVFAFFLSISWSLFGSESGSQVLRPFLSTANYLVVEIDDKVISPPLVSLVQEEMKHAEDYQGVIFLIDTPGGFLESCRNIVKEILSSPVPTLAFVYPKGARAGSAGALLALACDFVAMAPSTHIGAAHPVMLGGEDEKESPLQDKIVNDTVAFFLSYVRNKHPNVDEEVAKELITKSRALTEEEALKYGIIDAICTDVRELIAVAEEKGIIPPSNRVNIVYKRLEGMDLLMYYLTHPYVLYVLYSLSLLLILFELTHPGFGVPGVVGLIGLGLCLYGYGLLPVNYFGLFLILLGVVFFFGEVLTPGFGILALAGTISFVWGGLILWNKEGSFFSLPKSWIVLPGLLLGAIGTGIVYLALRIRRMRSKVGAESLVGQVGEVVEEVSPSGGKVFADGTYWSARSEDEGVIPVGRKVEVVRVEGLTLVVKERG